MGATKATNAGGGNIAHKDVATPEPEQICVCIMCSGEYKHPYGRWPEGGTCSKKCEQLKKTQDDEKRRQELQEFEERCEKGSAQPRLRIAA